MNRSIRTIAIKNFQSHEHTVIDFDEGINLITGTSNAGKSAALRAMYWALSNQPRGDSFIRQGSAFASVKITFYDGCVLRRFRGVEENFVEIKYADGKKERYEKFGTDYPDKVKEFLSLPRDNDILGNIYYSEQMAPLFLVNLSTADLPRAIGYLAGSDIMEAVCKNMMSDSRQIKRDMDKNRKDIKGTESDLKKFVHLDSDIKKINKCQEDNRNLTAMVKKLNSVKSCQDNYGIIMSDLVADESHLHGLNNVIQLQDIVDECKVSMDMFKKIEGMQLQYNTFADNIDDLKGKTDKIQQFFKNYKKSCLNKLKLHLSAIQEINVIQKEYDKYACDVTNIQDRVNDIAQEVEKNTALAKKLRAELKSSGYICKTCGQKLL